jgi:hypothetical protein
LSTFTEFFWKCAGANPEEAQNWQPKMQRKYAVFGWFVVMSGVVAGISGFLAFLTVFKSAVGAVFFSLFFGLVVFNLYRFVVVNIGYRLGMGKNKREQFISALPRIYMAFIIGFVVSKPIELFIFSPAISEYSVSYAEELYQKQLELVEMKFQDISEKTAQKEELEAEISKKQLQLTDFTSQKEALFIDSVGNEITPNPQLLVDLSERIRLARTELGELQSKNNPLIAELEGKITDRTELKKLELAQSKQKVKDSFSLLNQLTVLHEYVHGTWFLTTAMILFYVLPVLGKIKFSSDDYALVHSLNEKGEWLGNKIKMRSESSNSDILEETVESSDELNPTKEEVNAKPYKEKPKLGFVKTSILVVGLIILIGELNQRNIFTDMLSVMLVLTAILGWMRIVEREIAAIAMTFFTIIGSFAIFLMQIEHPILGVMLGVIVLLTFGILLIGSVLPIMRFLYTLGIFAFLVMAISFTVHTMIRGDLEHENPPKLEEHERVDKTDSLRVQKEGSDSDVLISHLRHWQDLHKHDYVGKLAVWKEDYEAAKEHKADYTYGDYNSNTEFWQRLYSYLHKHDKSELKEIAQMFDSIRVARKLNQVDFAEALVTCVQDIPYSLLAQKSCEEFKNNPKYAEIYKTHGCVSFVEYGLNSPTEFAYSLKGDCDTRTLFLFTLFSELGYKVAILNSERYEHSILGLSIPIAGKYKQRNGTRYYLWETTMKGWQAGALSPEMDNLDYWKFVLAN